MDLTAIANPELTVAFSTAGRLRHFESMKAVGGAVSTSASAPSLFAIALVNIVVVISVYRTLQVAGRGKSFGQDDFAILLTERGFLSRIFRPLFRLVTRRQGELVNVISQKS